MRWLYTTKACSILTNRILTDYERNYIGSTRDMNNVVVFGDEYDDADIALMTFGQEQLVRVDDVVYKIVHYYGLEERNFPCDNLQPAMLRHNSIPASSKAWYYDTNEPWFRDLIGYVRNTNPHIGADSEQWRDMKLFHVELEDGRLCLYYERRARDSFNVDVSNGELSDFTAKIEDVYLPSILTPSQVCMSFFDHLSIYCPILMMDGSVLLFRPNREFVNSPLESFSVFHLGKGVKDKSDVKALGVSGSNDGLVVILEDGLHVYEWGYDGRLRHERNILGVTAHSNAVPVVNWPRRRIKSAV